MRCQDGVSLPELDEIGFAGAVDELLGHNGRGPAVLRLVKDLVADIAGVAGPQVAADLHIVFLEEVTQAFVAVGDLLMLTDELEDGAELRNSKGDIVAAEPQKGLTNLGKATLYIGPLHAAIGLMILAVIIGNVGIFLSRKKENGNG